MLDFDQQGHIVTLTINRPDMRMLGEPAMAVFSDAVARINDDRNVRCVILTAPVQPFQPAAIRPCKNAKARLPVHRRILPMAIAAVFTKSSKPV